MESYGCDASSYGYTFEDGLVENLAFAFIVPSDFASGGVLKCYGWAANNGDVEENIWVHFGAVTEADDVHSLNDNDTYTCNVADTVYNVMNLTLVGLTAGDIGSGYFQRDGLDAADTIGGYFFIRSIILEYTADS